MMFLASISLRRFCVTASLVAQASRVVSARFRVGLAEWSTHTDMVQTFKHSIELDPFGDPATAVKTLESFVLQHRNSRNENREVRDLARHDALAYVFLPPETKSSDNAMQSSDLENMRLGLGMERLNEVFTPFKDRNQLRRGRRAASISDPMLVRIVAEDQYTDDFEEYMYSFCLLVALPNSTPYMEWSRRMPFLRRPYTGQQWRFCMQSDYQLESDGAVDSLRDAASRHLPARD